MSEARASDHKDFVAKVKVYAVAGTVAAFGIVWGFVASNAVGVTNRGTALAPTGTDPNAGGGTGGGTRASGGATAPQDAPGGVDFFAGGAGQAPTFPDANGGRAQLPTVDGWGSLGAGGGAGNLGGGFGGPVMRSGGS